jgi:hypothetical protein
LRLSLTFAGSSSPSSAARAIGLHTTVVATSAIANKRRISQDPLLVGLVSGDCWNETVSFTRHLAPGLVRAEFFRPRLRLVIS